VVLHAEECHTKAEALRRKKALKTAAGRRYIWSEIDEKYREETLTSIGH